MQAGLQRIDIEPMAAEQGGERRDVEQRCGSSEHGCKQRDRHVEPEDRREGHAGRACRDQRPEQQALRQLGPGPGHDHDQQDDERHAERRPHDHQQVALHVRHFASKRLGMEFEEGAEGEYEDGDRQIGPCKLGHDWNAEADDYAGNHDGSAVLSRQSQKALHVPTSGASWRSSVKHGSRHITTSTRPLFDAAQSTRVK